MPERHQKPQKPDTAQSLSLLERNSSTNINAPERQIQPLTLSDDERYILEMYARLNDFGKQTILAAVEGLTKHPKCMKTVEYTKTGNIITLK